MSPQRLDTDSQMFLRRGEARTEIRGHSSNPTQTKKCYSWTLVSLQHPPVSSVAVGNHTSTLKLRENYVFVIAAPAVEKSFFFFFKHLVGISKKHYEKFLFFFFLWPSYWELSYSPASCVFLLCQLLKRTRCSWTVFEWDRFFSMSVCNLVFFYSRCSLSDADLTWHHDCHLFMFEKVVFLNSVLVEPSKASGFLCATSQRCLHETLPGVSAYTQEDVCRQAELRLWGVLNV